MNSYVLLALVMVVIIGVLGWLFINGSPAMQAIIMFGGMGGGIVFAVMFAWEKRLYSALFPLKITAYGERYDAFTVTDSTRGKIVKDKKTGYEFIVTPGGKKWKMPDRRYIVKGNDNFLDIFDTKDQQFAININKENIEKVHKSIVPEDQRVWLADQAIPSITEATKPPLSSWAKVAEIAVLGMIAFIIVFPFLFGPDYVMKMNAVIQEHFAKETAWFQEMVGQLQEGSLTVNCRYVEPPTPPTPPPS